MVLVFLWRYLYVCMYGVWWWGWGYVLCMRCPCLPLSLPLRSFLFSSWIFTAYLPGRYAAAHCLPATMPATWFLVIMSAIAACYRSWPIIPSLPLPIACTCVITPALGLVCPRRLRGLPGTPRSWVVAMIFLLSCGACCHEKTALDW